MPYAPVNGIELYYTDHGTGTPIVFAHGVGGNHASWHHQVPFFARWFRVITFDHRGFGNSHDVPDSPSRSAFVDDLTGLLDHLNIDRAVIVAQSMGGGTALGFTIDHPERVLGLVMADTLGGITAPGRLQQRLDEVRKATDNLSQADRVVSKAFQEREPGRTQLYLEIASFNAANRRNMRGSAPVMPPTPETLARLANVPTLFLVGSDDVLYPPDIIETAYKLVPNAGFQIIPDAGHSAYFERPDAFNQVLFTFLQQNGLTATQAEPATAAAAR